MVMVTTFMAPPLLAALARRAGPDDPAARVDDGSGIDDLVAGERSGPSPL
jgi:hypothetical protein